MLLGTSPNSEPVASSLTKFGTAGAPVTKSCARTVSSPITIEPMPSVMISGWTPKIPIPMPLSVPISRPTPSAIRIATDRAARGLAGHDVRRRRGREAIERSMPPVSITIVWPAARIPSGAASQQDRPACSPDR